MRRPAILQDVKPAESAIIVPVLPAEHAVAAWRARLDPADDWGVPAHVTVLYPFLPPERLDESALERLAAAVRTVPQFEFALTRVEWFGDSVVWLSPEPDHPFRALTAVVWQQFPEAPPYAGVHLENVPHLTVGDGGPVQLLRQAGDAVLEHLPIHASVSAVHVMRGSREPNSWQTISELPLGP